MIFNTIKNDSHHMGMSQICTISGDYFRPSKPHSGKLCVMSVVTNGNIVSNTGEMLRRLEWLNIENQARLQTCY